VRQNSVTGLDLVFYAAWWYFVDEASEDWAAFDPLLGEVGGGFAVSERVELTAALGRPW
jgi:hypothetical protein